MYMWGTCILDLDFHYQRPTVFLFSNILNCVITESLTYYYMINVLITIGFMIASKASHDLGFIYIATEPMNKPIVILFNCVVW